MAYEDFELFFELLYFESTRYALSLVLDVVPRSYVLSNVLVVWYESRTRTYWCFRCRDHILPLRVGSYSDGTSVLRSLERRTRLCFVAGFVVAQDSRERQDSTEREGAARHELLQSAVRETAEGIAARLSLAP